MRRLLINTFTTLDGVIQAPGGPDEDRSGGFTHGGWSVKYWDETMVRRINDSMKEPFDLLLGRRTYEIFAAHWPHVTNDPIADGLNRATKHVASRSLTSVDWKNSRLLGGDVAEAVARLKREPGPEIQVHGSANLIQTLLRHDLIDEFRLWIFPLVLGTGKLLFDEGTIPAGLELRDCTTSGTGVIIATLERVGAVAHETMAESEVMSRFALEPTEAEIARRDKVAGEPAARTRRSRARRD
jgi:dihydrofolate reductase